MKKEQEPIRKILSNNLKKYRGIFHYSQAKLAEKANLSMQTLNDIEGCRRWVSSKTLSKLANVLSVCEYQLLLPENTDSNLKTNELPLKSLAELKKKIKEQIEDQFENAIKKGDFR